MKTKTEIETAIETLSAGAKGLTDFYEELYGESVNDFDDSVIPTAGSLAASRKADLFRKIRSLQYMVEELQSLKK